MSAAFREWLEKHQRIVAVGARVEAENGRFGPFRSARDAMEIAWDAACEMCACAQSPERGGEVSRGHASDLCRALKTAPFERNG